jgi:Zn-dependent protease with chaperone function
MNESRATRYQRRQRRARAAGLASGGAMLALVALTPVARGLASWADELGRGLPTASHAVVSLVLFVIALVVIWELAVLPAVLYLCLAVDSRYGRRRPSVDEVLAAQGQATLVALPAAFVAAAVVELSVWIAGSWWWPLAGLLLAAALVAALHGAPALLVRIGGARPISRVRLGTRLAALARDARVPIAGVHELPPGDGRLTALVTGAGRSRRIFISAELVRDWSDDEVAVVAAHELAHHAHHDLWRTLALDAALLSLGLWLAGTLSGSAAAPGAAAAIVGAFPGDLAALPFIALVAGAVWLACTPLRHAHSRQQERRADRFALALTGGADAFTAAIRRLGAQHLAEERPSAVTQWFYHRHPSVTERLALAQDSRSSSKSLNL